MLARPLLPVLLCLFSVCLFGCISPSAAKPVAARNADAVDRLSRATRADSAAFRAAVVSNLAAQREALLGQHARALIVAGYVTPEGPGVETFRASLPNSQLNDPLVREVREGRLSPDEAVAWLRDYCALLPVSRSRALRAEMFSGFAAVREFDAARDALLAAMDSRSADVAALFAEAGAGADALRGFASASYPVQDFARSSAVDVWNDQVVDRLSNKPGSARAARDLLRTVVGPDPVPAPVSSAP